LISGEDENLNYDLELLLKSITLKDVVETVEPFLLIIPIGNYILLILKLFMQLWEYFHYYLFGPQKEIEECKKRIKNFESIIETIKKNNKKNLKFITKKAQERILKHKRI